MATIENSTLIDGVQIARLAAYSDDRGRFMETFRKAWFPQRSWEIVQSNRSDSKAGVLRGLHYHFNQVDYWYVVAGHIQAVLADIRAGSPTEGAVQTIEMGDGRDVGIFIPIGVAHGFVALQDSTLTYVVDNYYSGADEFGVAWDDPQLAVPWQLADPLVSGRDSSNPRWADITDEASRPRFAGGE